MQSRITDQEIKQNDQKLFYEYKIANMFRTGEGTEKNMILN